MKSTQFVYWTMEKKTGRENAKRNLCGWCPTKSPLPTIVVCESPKPSLPVTGPLPSPQVAQDTATLEESPLVFILQKHCTPMQNRLCPRNVLSTAWCVLDDFVHQSYLPNAAKQESKIKTTIKRTIFCLDWDYLATGLEVKIIPIIFIGQVGTSKQTLLHLS